MNLSYQAKTADEFKQLCEWLRDNGFTKTSAAVTPQRDKGTFEAQYLAISGEKRMRLTNEEQGAMAQGKTREDVAKARLEALSPPVDDGEDVLS